MTIENLRRPGLTYPKPTPDHVLHSSSGCEEKESSLTIALSDAKYCIHKRNILLLHKTSKVVRKVFSGAGKKEIDLPEISLSKFKTTVAYLSDKMTFRKDIFELCEGLAALECEDEMHVLETKFVREIQNIAISRGNFINILRGYLWAKKWGLEVLQLDCKKFIQKAIQHNLQNDSEIEYIKEIFEKAQITIPLTLTCGDKKESENLFKNLSFFSRCLRSLQLKSVSSGNLEKLGLLTNLVSLSLSSAEVRDADLPFLLKLNITVLKLKNCPRVSEMGLKSLATLSFNTFSFTGIRQSLRSIKDAEIEVIGSFKLQALSLKGTLTNEITLEKLSLANLIHLNLSHCRYLRDTGLKILQLFPHLNSLHLNGCSIEGWGFEHFKFLNDLKMLKLRELNFVDAHLKHLTPLTKLEELDLGKCAHITDTGLFTLGNLSSLKSVNLQGCSEITPAGLKTLQQTLNSKRREFMNPASNSASTTINPAVSARVNPPNISDEDFYVVDGNESQIPEKSDPQAVLKSQEQQERFATESSQAQQLAHKTSKKYKKKEFGEFYNSIEARFNENQKLITDLDVQLKIMSNQLASANGVIEMQGALTQSLRSELDDENARTKKLEKEIENLFERYTVDKSNADVEREEATGKIAALWRELDEATKMHDREREEAVRDIEDLRKKFFEEKEKLEGEIKIIQKDLAKEKESGEVLRTKVADLEKNLKAKDDQIEGLEKLLDAEKAKVKTLEEQLVTANKLIIALKAPSSPPPTTTPKPLVNAQTNTVRVVQGKKDDCIKKMARMFIHCFKK